MALQGPPPHDAGMIAITLLLLALSPAPLDYPPSPPKPVSEVRHGVTVIDEYRWLEDLQSPETRQWIDAQDGLTRDWTDGPQLEALRTRIEQLADFDRIGVPMQGGRRLFYTTVRGLEGKPVLHVEERNGRTRVLADANTFDADTTLGAYWPSPDGKLVAYGVGKAGSRWSRVRLLRVDDGRHLPETLEGFAAATVAWLPDSRGFVYTRHDVPPAGQELSSALSPQEVRLHRPGTPQDRDELLFVNRQEPAWNYAPAVTPDGRTLVLHPRNGSATPNRVYLIDLRTRTLVKLFDDDSCARFYRGTSGDRLLLQTDCGAPRGRVVSVDPRRPAMDAWRDVLPQRDETLAFSSVVGDSILAVHLQDAKHVARTYDRSGRFVRDIPLPGLGAIWSGFIAPPRARWVFFNFGGLARPSLASTYRLDLRDGTVTPFRQPKLPFDPSKIVTGQVFFRSKDGTRVPMFIAHRKGFRRDGSAPTYLYGYGAFGWVAMPWYQPHVVAWLEMGGVYAMVNTRGGGEYGEEWRVAGIGRKRQNAIDDYLGAAEYLIANGYTSAARLVANGGSASAPLAAAAIVQRPELFGASLLDIPVFDLIRFPLFTGGNRWIPDFGSPDDPEDFAALLRYSPYHNIAPRCHPAVLVSAGEKDEIAVPSHAYKFVARLQSAQTCERPVLLSVARGAGHSFGRNAKESSLAQARQLVFTWRVVNGGRVADAACLRWDATSCAVRGAAD